MGGTERVLPIDKKLGVSAFWRDWLGKPDASRRRRLCGRDAPTTAAGDGGATFASPNYSFHILPPAIEVSLNSFSLRL